MTRNNQCYSIDPFSTTALWPQTRSISWGILPRAAAQCCLLLLLLLPTLPCCVLPSRYGTVRTPSRERKKIAISKLGHESRSKCETHHVPSQIIFLLALESAQVLHDAYTCVSGIFFCNAEGLFELFGVSYFLEVCMLRYVDSPAPNCP